MGTLIYGKYVSYGCLFIVAAAFMIIWLFIHFFMLALSKVQNESEEDTLVGVMTVKISLH